MAVTLNPINLSTDELRQFQNNVAEAVQALSEQRTSSAAVGVLPVDASRKLVGNEDFVIVNASQATDEIFLVLPGVKRLSRGMRVSVVNPSPSFGVTIKAVDIPAPSSPKINGADTYSIPKDTVASITVVSDGRAYYAVP